MTLYPRTPRSEDVANIDKPEKQKRHLDMLVRDKSGQYCDSLTYFIRDAIKRMTKYHIVK